MLPYQTLAFTKREKYKKVIQKQFKIFSPTWNDKFQLPDDGSYSLSDIQDYFEHINTNIKQ